MTTEIYYCSTMYIRESYNNIVIQSSTTPWFEAYVRALGPYGPRVGHAGFDQPSTLPRDRMISVTPALATWFSLHACGDGLCCYHLSD